MISDYAHYFVYSSYIWISLLFKENQAITQNFV